MTFSNCLHVRLLSDRTDEQSINTIFSHDSRMAVGDPEVSRLDIGELKMRPVYHHTHFADRHDNNQRPETSNPLMKSGRKRRKRL